MNAHVRPEAGKRRADALTLGSNPAHRGAVTMAARYANRHGLITGATGSGKSWSLCRLASEFNRLGVPVFAPDMKGDLAAIVERGIPNGVPAVRLVPGINFRLNMREMGGDLCARAMGLSDAQRGALDAHLDAGCTSPAGILAAIHGRSGESPTIRVLRRGLSRLDGANFGPIGFDVASLIAKPAPVTILHARDLAEQGATYAVSIAYMLRELYTRLPEVGDRATPVLAFFIDEAHMLLNGASAELVAEIERMVRLIRSRGVSLWFVTQSPADLPDGILAQLQNRIQHSLRAVTPRDWRAVRAAVETMPPGNFLDPVATLGTLPPGRAMVSLVGRSGQPGRTELCAVEAPDWCPAEITNAPIPLTVDLFQHPVPVTVPRVAPAARRSAADARRAATVARVGRTTLRLLAGILGALLMLALMSLVGATSGTRHRAKRHGRH